MDISRDEQRVLHALAQGGRIALLKTDAGKPTGLEFFNRDGWLMTGCTLPLFRKLAREQDMIEGDYHIHWLEQYLAGKAAK